MGLVAFDPNEVEAFYQGYYQHQDGNGLSVFRGKRIMDGNGLGSILGGVFRAVAPTLKGFAKSAISTLGKTALNVATDAIRGEDVGASAQKRFRSAGASILNSSGSALSSINPDDMTVPPEVVKKELKRKSPARGRRRPAKRQKTIF